MRRPANERVEVLVANLKVDVQPVERPRVVQAAEYVLHHGTVEVAFLRGIIRCLLAHLDARRVEGHVLVLERGDEDDVLEVLQPRRLRELEQRRLLSLLGVAHA